MKRLIIVCEGPTEREFCNSVLADFFINKGIVLETPLLKHSGGGVVSWQIIRRQLISHLNEGNPTVTTFIDYYGIKDGYGFPQWERSKGIDDNKQKMEFVENAMSQDIPENLRSRFVPHLQLHEFESLLFSDINVFEKNFMPSELDINKLKDIVAKFPNPEDINNSPNTAPSKRLADAVSGYRKVLYGNYLAIEIGLNSMLDKCPHFRDWISQLCKIN